MKRFMLALVSLLILTMNSQGIADGLSQYAASEDEVMYNVVIQIGETRLTALFYDNDSALAIIDQMPFSLDMRDYGRQEKISQLSFDLPDAATVIPDRIHIGDIHLYGGSNLVLFYTAFSNVYSYVPVGYIEDTEGLVEALGSGSVTAMYSFVAE